VGAVDAQALHTTKASIGSTEISRNQCALVLISQLRFQTTIVAPDIGAAARLATK